MFKKIIVSFIFLTLSLPAFSQPVFVPDSAELISYDNPTYHNVQDGLDAALYTMPQILTFTNNHNDVENGTSITSTILNWTVNKTMSSESLNNSIGSVTPATLLTYTHTSTYTTTRTYTLTVGDGTNTDTANTSITFKNRNYSGVSANSTLTNGQILALATQPLSTSKTLSQSFSPSAQYIWHWYKTSYGAATWTVNGLVNTDFTCMTQDVTNASGAVVNYTGCRTGNLLTGTYAVTAQ